MAAVTPASTETSAVKTLLASGVELPKWPHYILTGILPGLVLIPYLGPVLFSFPYTFGTNGLNLLASNSMAWAAAKLIFNMMCQLFYKVLAANFGSQWWLPAAKVVLTYANPWYTYDILRVYSPDFETKGYKIPFMDKLTSSTLAANKPPTNHDIGYQPLDASGNPVLDSTGAPAKSYGWMGAVAFGAMTALLIPAFSIFTAVLPPDIQAQINPWLSFIITTVGAVAALGGGGITSMVLLPKMISSVKSSFDVATAPRGGGDGTQQGGSSATSNALPNYPSIQDVAESLLNKSEGKPAPKQAGGADQESNLFMGILAFTMVSGVSLALVRSKGVSTPQL